ncbi:MBL fold metallo-hydrolase [Opitutus sp. ER46]|uniref:MBL fold metallo-hydrolase n=1 Tax=Opitutus sp. ER46 TaxID=2161864 RepID=UPI000D3254AD|nr:MBL fold metallo-hydrolase [Opitutus sp. ER46]PTX99037.1 MBL fold metallo-hydrolase [Opitutus sp. ER46]
MKLTDLNRDGGIGANSLFIQLGELNLLIDCGLHPKKVGRAATPDLRALRGVTLDLIIITHCHLDHIGSLPVVMREHPNTPVLMSSSSRLLLERMLHNSANVMMRQREAENIPDYPLFTHEEIDRCAKRFTPLPFGQAKHFRGAKDEIEIIFHGAGHVAGAVGVELRHKRRAIFFTGDVLFENQRTIPAAKFPAGHFDTLVMETTRGTTERPLGKERVHEVARLVASINDTIQRGGSFLMPVFALGRMQEIMSILHDARKFGRLVDCPIYASGLGVDLSDYFDDIAKKTKHVIFNRNMMKDLRVKPLPRKLNAGEDPKQNAVYVVSSGMMVANTPSYTLASGLVGHARNTVGFVGYCDPDTPGGELLASKPGDDFLFEAAHVKAKVKARVDRFELSGHADREELLEFAVQTKARSIVLTHGDPPARAWFAEQLAQQATGSKVLDPVPLQTYQV